MKKIGFYLHKIKCLFKNRNKSSTKTPMASFLICFNIMALLLLFTNIINNERFLFLFKTGHIDHIIQWDNITLERAVREALDNNESSDQYTKTYEETNIEMEEDGSYTEDTITIYSGGIEEIVPEYLEEDIWLSDIYYVTSLDLSERNLTEISALKEFQNLRELDISGNRISDLSPITYNNRLEKLDISGNPIEDVSPV